MLLPAQRLKRDSLRGLEYYRLAEVARKVVDHDALAAQFVRAVEQPCLGFADYALRHRLACEVFGKSSADGAGLRSSTHFRFDGFGGDHRAQRGLERADRLVLGLRYVNAGGEAIARGAGCEQRLHHSVTEIVARRFEFAAIRKDDE